MTGIRYVCLSDLHFGQNDGLLTNLSEDGDTIDVTRPSPVLVALVDGLGALLAQNPPDAPLPTLILNGDILEAAFTTLNEAAMAFERFVELAFPVDGPRLFGRVIFLPGNHDHHLWEMARETQYVNHIRRDCPAGSVLDEPWHTTNLLVEDDTPPLTSYFLTNLIQRHPHLQDLEVEVAYPNFGLHRPALSRVVIFHHGHFVEKLYHLLTSLADSLFPDREPAELVWEVEAENFAWIDFFWGSLGRSGRVGPLVQNVYNSLGYQEARNNLLGNLARSLAEDHDLPGWTDKMEAFILKKGLVVLADWLLHHERQADTAEESKTDGAPADKIPLSEAAGKGLTSYLAGPVRQQLLMELDAFEANRVTFVFGHTHKPYQTVQTVEGYPHPMSVYNTGGWVVETDEPNPVHGASALLLDDDLNAVSLHLYQEDDYDVRIEEVDPAPAPDPKIAGDNPLAAHARRALAATDDTWRTFAHTVQAQVTFHAQARARRRTQRLPA